jgi:hypothetical protein
MSSNHKEYLRYTEYYIISGAYQIVNIVNEILTHSAYYSVNVKEYLRNQIVSKQVALNEIIRNNNDIKINNNLNDNDVDEDGFVVIKMRKQKRNNINGNSNKVETFINNNDNQMLKDVQDVQGVQDVQDVQDVQNFEEIIEKIISDIISNLD